MEGLEMTCFQIISSVGTARSSYIEAIQKAKAGILRGRRTVWKQGSRSS